MSNQRVTHTLRLSAIAGLLAGCDKAPSADGRAGPSATPASTTIMCVGVNSCAGKGECKTAKNECAGKNACKGQGVTKMSAEDCKAKGGTPQANMM